MDLRDVVENHRNKFIYGAGRNARIFSDYCLYKAIMYECFLVSDYAEVKEKHINRKGVKHLSEIQSLAGSVVIVAVGEELWDEIRVELEARKEHGSFECYFLTETDLLFINRELHPIECSVFLEGASPGGHLMGCDRGLSLSRYYINSFLKQGCRDLHAQKTYEVGEDRYGSEYFPTAVHEVLNYCNGVDLTRKETLPCAEFDVFICTQVFNFIYDVKSAIEGSFYVLKEDGVLLATVAGNISQISRSDMKNYGDYWRFTYLGIQRLMTDVFGENNVSVIPYGNAMATTAYIQGMCYEDLPHPELLDVTDPDYALVIGVIGRKHG